MPSAAPATPLLHDRSARCADALMWAEGSQPVLALEWPGRTDPDVMLRFGELMITASIPDAASAARSLITPGGEIAEVDILVGAPLLFDTTRHPIVKPSFAELFQELRERLRLPVQKYAVLLGTTRRTLYHWLETGRAQEQALWRVERLAEWVDEIQDRLPPAEIRRLMDPDVPDSIAVTLITQGDDAATDRLRQLVATIDQPRRARRLPELAVAETTAEPPTLAEEEFGAALSAFASPRDAVRETVRWAPRELTDSPRDDTV